MKVNNKIIQRAVAQSIVRDTPDLIKLVKKYKPVDDNISLLDLLFDVQYLLENDRKFAAEYTNFLLQKKRLINYNSATGLLAGVTNLIGSVVNSSTQKKEQQLEYSKLSSQNTQQLMQFMMQEEQAQLEKEKQKTNIIYIAIGSFVLLTGIVIFAKKM